MSSKTANSLTSKAHELRIAIQRRCHHLPPSRLDEIIAKIDPAQRYFIQTTKNPQKFLNIISSENIITDAMCVMSETTLLYGSFTPGCFTNLHGSKTITAGSMDKNTPAAALKSSFGNRFFARGKCSYTLVIYEP